MCVCVFVYLAISPSLRFPPFPAQLIITLTNRSFLLFFSSSVKLIISCLVVFSLISFTSVVQNPPPHLCHPDVEQLCSQVSQVIHYFSNLVFCSLFWWLIKWEAHWPLVFITLALLKSICHILFLMKLLKLISNLDLELIKLTFTLKLTEVQALSNSLQSLIFHVVIIRIYLSFAES